MLCWLSEDFQDLKPGPQPLCHTLSKVTTIVLMAAKIIALSSSRKTGKGGIYMISLMKPNKKKSSHDRSGEHGGNTIGASRTIN